MNENRMPPFTLRETYIDRRRRFVGAWTDVQFIGGVPVYQCVFGSFDCVLIGMHMDELSRNLSGMGFTFSLWLLFDSARNVIH